MHFLPLAAGHCGCCIEILTCDIPTGSACTGYLSKALNVTHLSSSHTHKHTHVHARGEQRRAPTQRFSLFTAVRHTYGNRSTRRCTHLAKQPDTLTHSHERALINANDKQCDQPKPLGDLCHSSESPNCTQPACVCACVSMCVYSLMLLLECVKAHE